MAKKISQFTEATTIKSGDISVVVQDGETKQFPLNLLATKAQADQYKAGVETQLADYEQEITDIKNQYDKELYTPTITVTNTSMVKTGQGDTVDYSASVEDGVAKSATLSGQTLVNVYDYTSSTFIGGVTIENGIITFKANGGWVVVNNKLPMLKPNTNYTIFVNILSNTLTYSGSANNYALLIEGVSGNTGFNSGYQIPKDSIGIFKKLLTTKESFSTTHLSDARISSSANGGEIKFTYMIIEGDYTNVDIPYFEGMQSVKMPILTTTGKNLFGLELVQGSHGYGDKGKKPNFVNGDSRVTNVTGNYIKINPNTKITFSISNDIVFSIAELDINGYGLGDTGWVIKSSHTITTKEKTSYIGFNFRKLDNSTITAQEVLDSNPMLEISDTVTTYEPFKSNILTVNEEVELRGIGEVQDTLDCLTGELIQNVNEIVLTGNANEKWTKNEGLSTDEVATFVWKVVEIKATGNFLCDKLSNKKMWSDKEIGIWFDSNLIISISSSIATTVEQFRTYLNETPFTVYYQSSEKSFKTVVLNPSGTLASETPYMWKNGNIQLSSDGLIPGLDYAVTTSRIGVIENNMSETIANEKRIHSLEVMLAQSTITAAADAVSLQSDLEATTMSVDGAQLDTGNTQDDFLYEMILLLIEKDAYDESLFDKVCAFYLYGKLSDEQFTNIYNLLYPEEE